MVIGVEPLAAGSAIDAVIEGRETWVQLRLLGVESSRLHWRKAERGGIQGDRRLQLEWEGLTRRRDVVGGQPCGCRRLWRPQRWGWGCWWGRRRGFGIGFETRFILVKLLQNLSPVLFFFGCSCLEILEELRRDTAVGGFCLQIRILWGFVEPELGEVDYEVVVCSRDGFS